MKESKYGGSAGKVKASMKCKDEDKELLRSGDNPLIHSMNFMQSRETLNKALNK